MLGTTSDEVSISYGVLDSTEDVALTYYVRVDIASDLSLHVFSRF